MSTAAAPSLPPGPPYPTALQTLGWIARPLPFLERCRARYGDMFTLRIGVSERWVVLADPDAIKQVFTGDPALLHAGEGNAVLGPILGRNSVLLLDDEPHLRQRKLLLPPLHGERMQRFGALMTEIAEREAATWPAGTTMPLHPRMQAITLEIILRAVFGIREADRLDELRAQLIRLLEITGKPLAGLTVAVLGPERVTELGIFRRQLKPVDDLLYDEIRRRREDPDLASRDDILSMLVQARHADGSAMADEELRDELMTLLVAGHETTATALSWALERLLRHPEMLDRLAEEVAAGGEEYLDAVVKETLRLRPVLPVVVRMLKADMEIGGRLLPEGVAVAPCIHLVHRDPDVYPEPARFRPERFLERPAGTYTWIPFGGGIRRCLGASFALYEMKAVLTAVVRAAPLRPSRPAAERVARRAITLTPARGAEVVVGAGR